MAEKKIKIGIVGCGAIGRALGKFIVRELKKEMALVALCDKDPDKARRLREELGQGRVVSLQEAVSSSDLVIEAACAKAAHEVARLALGKGRDVLIMSVGGILGRERGLAALARRKKRHIYFPSGAICGLDGVKALALAGIQEIVLKTYKPPKALEGADYVVSRGIALKKIRRQTRIFEGTAREAVKAFPQNINIVALLSLAAGGRVVPRVEVFVAPGSRRNIHVVEVRSKAAQVRIACENEPSPDNPKTSYLAVLSAEAVLQGMGAALRVGG